jgi:hypothetical protein
MACVPAGCGGEAWLKKGLHLLEVSAALSAIRKHDINVLSALRDAIS